MLKDAPVRTLETAARQVFHGLFHRLDIAVVRVSLRGTGVGVICSFDMIPFLMFLVFSAQDLGWVRVIVASGVSRQG